MGKTNSHQFSGTLGEKIEMGLQPENQREMVIAWARDVQKMIPQSKRQQGRFNTATVAFDEVTGNLYYGRNGGIDKFGDTINPNLERILPDNTKSRYPTVWNCSESDAINRALNDGAKISNLHIYTIHTTKDDFGKPKKSCETCTEIYKSRVKKNSTGWR